MSEQEDVRAILEQAKKASEALKRVHEGLSASFKQLGEEVRVLTEQFSAFKDKLEQTVALDEALKAKRFTNKDEVDVKIREKVIAALVENFRFEQINKPIITEDVVVVDDAPTQPKVEEPQPAKEEIVVPEEELAPTRDLVAAREADPSKDPLLRRQAKDAAIKDLPPGAQMYVDAFNKQGEVIGLDFNAAPSPEDLENITPEDLQAMSGADPELAKKVEALKRLAPKKMGSVGERVAGKNKSLSRRE